MAGPYDDIVLGDNPYGDIVTPKQADHPGFFETLKADWKKSTPWKDFKTEWQDTKDILSNPMPGLHINVDEDVSMPSHGPRKNTPAFVGMKKAAAGLVEGVTSPVNALAMLTAAVAPPLAGPIALSYLPGAVRAQGSLATELGTAVGSGDTQGIAQKSIELGVNSLMAPALALGGVKGTVKGAKTVVDKLVPEMKQQEYLNKLAMHSAPVTTAVSPVVGEKLIEYAHSREAGQALAESKATDVLAHEYENPVFSKELGGVIVEDILRQVKEEKLAAGDTAGAAKVNSMVGNQEFPFASEAEYQAAKARPDIQDALSRHIATVQDIAEQAHQEVGGSLSSSGKDTGAFVNLKAILEPYGPSPSKPMGDYTPGAKQGDLSNPLKRGSVFSKERKGTGQTYEFDYRTLAERMVKANYEEVNKQRLYKAYVDEGLGVELSPGEKPPEGFSDKVEIQRRGGAPGQTVVKNLWLKEGLGEELRNAQNVESPIVKGVKGHIFNAITRAQTELGVDAVWHTGNMLAAVNGATRNKALGNVFGAREIDTGVRIAKNVYRAVINDPITQREVAQYSKVAPGRTNPQSSLGTGSFISLVDKAGRLTMNQLYNELVDAKMTTDTPLGRSRFVEQMGQYNRRLMGKMQREMREMGLSPFIVAGKTFNALALKRITGDPGVKAANPQADKQMRFNSLLGLVTSAVVAPVVGNMMLNGTPTGRKGTPLGAIDTGKTDSSGKIVYVDPMQLTMARRGARITGLQAGIRGMQNEQEANVIAKNAFKDVFQGILHPWTGPAIDTIGLLKEGKSAGEIVKSINPAVAAVMDTSQGPSVGQNLAKVFGGAIGVKTANPQRDPRAVEGVSGKPLEQMNFRERVLTERKVEENKKPIDPKYRTQAILKAEQLMDERQVELEKKLPEGMMTWLDKAGIVLPRYKDTIQDAKVTVPLTTKEEARYRELIQTAYQDTIAKFQGRAGWEGLQAKQKQAQFDRLLTQEKIKAKRLLERELGQ